MMRKFIVSVFAVLTAVATGITTTPAVAAATARALSTVTKRGVTTVTKRGASATTHPSTAMLSKHQAAQFSSNGNRWKTNPGRPTVQVFGTDPKAADTMSFLDFMKYVSVATAGAAITTGVAIEMTPEHLKRQRVNDFLRTLGYPELYDAEAIRELEEAHKLEQAQTATATPTTVSASADDRLGELDAIGAMGVFFNGVSVPPHRRTADTILVHPCDENIAGGGSVIKQIHEEKTPSGRVGSEPNLLRTDDTILKYTPSGRVGSGGNSNDANVSGMNPERARMSEADRERLFVQMAAVAK